MISNPKPNNRFTLTNSKGTILKIYPSRCRSDVLDELDETAGLDAQGSHEKADMLHAPGAGVSRVDHDTLDEIVLMFAISQCLRVKRKRFSSTKLVKCFIS